MFEMGFPVLEDQLMDRRSANPDNQHDGRDSKNAIRDIQPERFRVFPIGQAEHVDLL
jgi:hypothetical protein